MRSPRRRVGRTFAWRQHLDLDGRLLPQLQSAEPEAARRRRGSRAGCGEAGRRGSSSPSSRPASASFGPTPFRWVRSASSTAGTGQRTGASSSSSRVSWAPLPNARGAAGPASRSRVIQGGFHSTRLGGEPDASTRISSACAGSGRRRARRESVWDYPRPPRIERDPRRLRVELGGETLADSTRSLRVLETASPPTFYVPREDVRMELLSDAPGEHTFCEWKGRASYLHAEAGSSRAERAAWFYPRAPPGLRRARWPHRVLRRPRRRLLPGRRARPPAGRQLLRGLGHRRDRGALQGRAGHRGLVAPLGYSAASSHQ